MTRRQKQILVGMLLGDAHLETTAWRTDGAAQDRTFGEAVGLCRLEVRHEWRDWVRTPPKARDRRNRLGTVFDEHRVYDPFARRVRTVPIAVLSRSPKGDPDGSRAHSVEHGRVVHGRWLKKIESVSWSLPQHQSFTDREVELLQVGDPTDVGVETRVRKQRDGLQIYVPSPSASELTAFITRNAAEHEIQVAELTDMPKT